MATHPTLAILGAATVSFAAAIPLVALFSSRRSSKKSASTSPKTSGAPSVASGQTANDAGKEDPASAITVLRQLEIPAMLLDATLAPVYANAHARDDRDTLSARVLSDPKHIRAFKHALTTGAPYLRVSDPEDASDTTRVRAFRVADRYLAVLIDDTGEALRLQRMRRDFIANVSHELKTPAAAISLLAEAIAAGAADPETVATFAQNLLQESNRLSELTRDIIDLSNAQSEIQPENREAVDLRELVRAEVSAHKTLAKPRGITLRLTEPEDAERQSVILGRKNALGTAISNLLSNAIRYSPEASTVDVTMRFDEANLEVSVADHGPGIPFDMQERIFERFFRGDSARTREAGGTGLGLSIVRHTMRGHGGEVNVESIPGEGATFTLTFPLHESELAAISADANLSEEERDAAHEKAWREMKKASKDRARTNRKLENEFQQATPAWHRPDEGNPASE